MTVRFRGEPLKVLRASLGEGSGAEAGAGVGTGAIMDPAAGLVGCARGILKLLEVQPPGKRAMSWRDFANGHAVKSQEVLQGGPLC